MEKRKRLLELDYARVVAMVGVIAIHVSSTFVELPSAAALPGGMTLARILNQLPCCAVPLFILLSGLSLGLSPGPDRAVDFWKRRLGKLLPYYLGWTLFYWWTFRRGEPLRRLWTCIWNGTTVAHLYFIVILLQLYLLYPLLKRALDRWADMTLIASVLVTLVFRQGIANAMNGMGPVSFFLGKPCWELFPTWVGFFVMGMYLAKLGVDKLTAWSRRWAWPLAGMALGYGLWYLYEGMDTNTGGSLKVSLLFYAPLVLAALLGVAGRWKGKGWLDRAMSFGAKHSLSVFYVHVAVLEAFRQVPFLMDGARGMVLLLLATTAASLAVAWVLDSGIELARKGLEKLHA